MPVCSGALAPTPGPHPWPRRSRGRLLAAGCRRAPREPQRRAPNASGRRGEGLFGEGSKNKCNGGTGVDVLDTGTEELS